MSMPSTASRKLDWKLLGRAAIRRIGRFLFPDPHKRARIGSALYRTANSMLTLGGRRAGIRAAIHSLTETSIPTRANLNETSLGDGASLPGQRISSSFTPYKLEIDRARLLQEMPVNELLEGTREGFAVLVPAASVHVKHHALSFPSSNPEEAKNYQDHHYYAPEMVIERLRDHYWFPDHGFLISRQGKVWRNSILGQYADPYFLETGVVEKRGEDLLFHETLLHGCPVIEESVAIASHFASARNYGHFLLDMVPLIHKLRTLGFPLISTPLLDWQKAIYRRLDIDPESIRNARDRVILLRDFIVSNRHMCGGTQCPSPQIREVFDAVLRRVHSGAAREHSKRVFVARGPYYHRELRNRMQLVDSLAKREFTIVRPERLPLDEQVATFAGADVIVSEFGAAMANVVFCKPHTKVVEIIPEEQNDPWSVHLCAALDLEHITLFHKVEDADRIPLEVGGRVLKNVFLKYDADVELVCRVVDQLIAEPRRELRAMRPSGSPDLGNGSFEPHA